MSWGRPVTEAAEAMAEGQWTKVSETRPWGVSPGLWALLGPGELWHVNPHCMRGARTLPEASPPHLAGLLEPPVGPGAL